MSEAAKVCPICEARNHWNAALCSTCGTAIAEVEPQPRPNSGRRPPASYDDRHGESDLFEGSVHAAGRAWTAVIFALGILLGIGIAVMAMAPVLGGRPANLTTAAPISSPTRAILPTVTWSAPTATHTPKPAPTLTAVDTDTPAPCIQRVAGGDTLIHIIIRCGHSHRDIIPTVAALNGIADETRIQIGQEIVVPLPSPTADPNAPATDTPEAAAGGPMQSDGLTLLAFDPFAPTATATLLPGVTWHIVQADENMIVIAVQYDANAKVLSDLNPEIDFARCDFGMAYGGPDCIVNLYQGQRVRVPAPTPTLTLAPTLSGSETPPPMPSPTFNLPHAINPPNQAFFGRQEQITLRWVTTGSLSANEVYRVEVSDIGSGDTFTADTGDLFFILPPAWQAPDSQRHHYIWQVSIFNTKTDRALFSTATRTFIWQGAGEDNP